jgi:AraC-like DNA-binding protein
MADPAFMFESRLHAAEDRYDAWLADIGTTFSTRLAESMCPDDFGYSVHGWQVGSAILLQALCDDHLERRGPREIRGLPMDHYCVVIPFSGEVRCEAGGLRHRVRPGQVLVVDLAREWSNEFVGTGGGTRFISIWIPRATLDRVLNHAIEPHGIVFGGALAAIFASHVSTLSSATAHLQPGESADVMRATLQLLATSVRQSTDALRAARPALQVTLLGEACRYIDRHLDQATLTPDSIAKAFGVSRASLYRLFEPLGGVAAYVKERRLERIRELILSSDDKPRFAGLAESHGFSSAAHFSQAFRERFGCTPGEVREQRDQGSPDASPAAAGTRSDGPFFRALKSLRD